MAELTEAQKRKRDEIAERLKADPEFHPQEGRTKEESAFAVATAQAQEMTHNPEQTGVDQTARDELMKLAADLEMASMDTDYDLVTTGRLLRLAVARGDWKRAKKELGSLRDGLKEDGLEQEAEYVDYLYDIVSEQVKEAGVGG